MERNLIGKSYMVNQKNGEYVFVYDIYAVEMGGIFPISILFTVNDKGEVSYSTPSLHGYNIE